MLTSVAKVQPLCHCPHIISKDHIIYGRSRSGSDDGLGAAFGVALTCPPRNSIQLAMMITTANGPFSVGMIERAHSVLETKMVQRLL